MNIGKALQRDIKKAIEKKFDLTVSEPVAKGFDRAYFLSVLINGRYIVILIDHEKSRILMRQDCTFWRTIGFRPRWDKIDFADPHYEDKIFNKIEAVKHQRQIGNI